MQHNVSGWREASPKPPTAPPDMIHIQMDEDTAQTLMSVCRLIAGPGEGRRGHMDGIARALYAADIPLVSLESVKGSIHAA